MLSQIKKQPLKGCLGKRELLLHYFGRNVLLVLCLLQWWEDLNLVYLQGKSFIKDALKCMAHGLRHKFSCISRKCLAIKDMVFQLQRECYMKHNLCSAAKDNVNVIVEMIHFQDLFPKGWVRLHTQLQATPLRSFLQVPIFCTERHLMHRPFTFCKQAIFATTALCAFEFVYIKQWQPLSAQTYRTLCIWKYYFPIS